MAERELSASELYLVALRIIQPARVQDILKAYTEIWGIEVTDSVRTIVATVHEKMRRDGLLVDVRKGTFVLDAKGMGIVARLVNERTLDNARLFLMKTQRKQYHRFAGRH
ncbi:hypothetical protein [Mesorhizobium sp. BR1-1-14]|uniref:hypothetical protein n=1 Tax=Mesorhizobium sp. BR1-1-14 TaxID=2876655 RepID=UPI001CD127B6|nr:hypothetical protein [Mesorhizobium sp. BR1-1-14]